MTEMGVWSVVKYDAVWYNGGVASIALVECAYVLLVKVGIYTFSDEESAHARLDSLDELTNLAVTLFSPIRNRGMDPLPMIDSHPFGEEQKGVSKPYIQNNYVFNIL